MHQSSPAQNEKNKKTMQRFPNEKFFSRNQFHEKFRENDFTKISTRNLNFFFPHIV